MITIQILQLIFCCFLLPFSLTKTTLHDGPIGISMCELICSKTIGCETYTYLPEQLTCLEGSLSNTVNSKMVTRRLKTPVPNDQLHCQPGSRVFNTRKGVLVCIEGNGRSTNWPGKNVALNSNQFRKLSSKGYREFTSGNKLYLFNRYTKKKSWDKAMEQCRDDGGFLAQFNKEFKWEIVPKVVNLSKAFFPPLTWIGLRDRQQNNKFVWADGTELTDKKRWYSSILKTEPSHVTFGRAEDCVSFRYRPESNDMILYDFTCSNPLEFLCEVVIQI